MAGLSPFSCYVVLLFGTHGRQKRLKMILGIWAELQDPEKCRSGGAVSGIDAALWIGAASGISTASGIDAASGGYNSSAMREGCFRA